MCCRASNLDTLKRSISYYMPNKHEWNAGFGWGNPTKSKEVNNVIKTVEKWEIRGGRRESQAWQPFSPKESSCVIKCCRKNFKYDISHGLVCLFLFTYHHIFRLEDACKCYKTNIFANHRFDFVLMAKLCWNKNANKERDCPLQIMVVSNNYKSCLVIALGLHLETLIMTRGYNKGSDFMFHFEKSGKGDLSAKRTNSYCRSVLSHNILKDEIFLRVSGRGKICYHLRRKK